MHKEALGKIVFNENKNQYEATCTYMEVIGVGKRATVFKIKNVGKAIKVFHPKYVDVVQKEVEAYSLLSEENPYFAKMYEYGENFVIIDYIEGYTLYECLSRGIIIEETVIKQIDEAIEYARSKGLNPSDVHVKNIILNGNQLKIIDLEGFVREGKCYRWKNLKRYYYRYYMKKWFPKKIPLKTVDMLATSYRKLEFLFGYKQKR